MRVLNLAEIQKVFHSSIRHQQTSDVLLSQIKDNPLIPLQRRVSIYQIAYKIRLSECIREDFPKTCELMGQENFEQTIKDFILETSSTTSQLAEYSEDFVEYLQKTSNEIYELASKEWMEILSLRAPEPVEKLSLEAIQAGIAFVFQLHPATKYKNFLNKTLVSYRSNDETYFLDLNLQESQWLYYFQETKTIEQLELLLETGKMSEQELWNLIFDWIKKEIIYCSHL